MVQQVAGRIILWTTTVPTRKSLKLQECQWEKRRVVTMGRETWNWTWETLKRQQHVTQGQKKYGSSHIKNDKPVVLWKKEIYRSKEVCRMPPAEYSPEHKCMGTKIDYSKTTWGSPVPTHGPHRPVWASFGMYRYLPPERWQHNLEHGVVVLLYHPCLNVDRRGKQQLVRLIHTVKGCIRKHVVTPSRRWTTLKHPLTLVAWGCSLSLSSLSLSKVRNFIKSHGLQAPEGNYTKDGQYDLYQVYKAGIPQGSTIEDSVLCPKGY